MFSTIWAQNEWIKLVWKEWIKSVLNSILQNCAFKNTLELSDTFLFCKILSFCVISTLGRVCIPYFNYLLSPDSTFFLLLKKLEIIIYSSLLSYKTHQLDGHEFEQALGVGDGQESLACCSPWGCKESDMTEWLNWSYKRKVKDKKFKKYIKIVKGRKTR